MFGGEDLAELVLRGALEESDKTGHDPRFAAVLSGEKKSFLVALTRARRIMISAVWNDSMSPSDFLFGYLPEYYPRNRQQAPFTTVGAHAGFAEYDLAGLDATHVVGQRRPRGSGHCSTAAGCRKGRRDCVDTPVRAWCARRKSAELGVCGIAGPIG